MNTDVVFVIVTLPRLLLLYSYFVIFNQQLHFYIVLIESSY